MLASRAVNVARKAGPADETPRRDNGRRAVLILASISTVVYGALAAAGDLRDAVPLYLAAHAVLVAFGVAAWIRVRASGDERVLRVALVAAVGFRLVAAIGGPALSDDVYRYVWDGRVQVAGHHPYRHAPDAAELAPLRDEAWESVNHPEVRTIYPALAELAFAALATIEGGVTLFQFVFGLADVAVLFALLRLLRALGLPRHRAVLYGWCPLAVMETAGSGHVEPLGVALLVLAVTAASSGRPLRAGGALGAAVMAKLVPLVAAPAIALASVRRGRLAATAGLFAAGLLVTVAVLVAPYAATGPAFGSGLGDYAERWERNATVFAIVQAAADRLDTGERLKPAVAAVSETVGEGVTGWLYRNVWPRELAKGIVGVIAGVWILGVALRSRADLAARLVATFAGLWLLAPTVHPWYGLWLAPFAVAVCAPGSLVWLALLPLAYLDVGGDVPVGVRAVEYGVPVLVGIACAIARRRATSHERASMRP